MGRALVTLCWDSVLVEDKNLISEDQRVRMGCGEVETELVYAASFSQVTLL